MAKREGMVYHPLLCRWVPEGSYTPPTPRATDDLVPVGNGHWRKWTANTIAVNPVQAEHFNNQLKEHGVVGAEYSPHDGKLRASSRAASNAAAAVRGFHNNTE